MATGSKPRVDGQITALAAEFFVAAELLKRSIQCSVTFGNAKAVDLLAYRPGTTGEPAVRKHFAIQVKALKNKTYFLGVSTAKIKPDLIYVFVVLNRPGIPVDYYILPGTELLRKPERFGKFLNHPTHPGLHPNSLQEYRDNWAVFDRDPS